MVALREPQAQQAFQLSPGVSRRSWSPLGPYWPRVPPSSYTPDETPHPFLPLKRPVALFRSFRLFWWFACILFVFAFFLDVLNAFVVEKYCLGVLNILIVCVFKCVFSTQITATASASLNRPQSNHIQKQFEINKPCWCR